MTDQAELRAWLNGQPYYCKLCGAGAGEFYACEMPDCKLEDEATAIERQRRRTPEPSHD